MLPRNQRLTVNYLIGTVDYHILDYPTPTNLGYFWSFGSLAGIALAFQLITGILLGMHYIPDSVSAFSSVEETVRDVSEGTTLRYVHSNGASFFFICVYVHIFRGIYYGSYVRNAKVWVAGIAIFAAMMATAFLGYVLPWGQMSFWGATVITNLFTTIPFVGFNLVEWLWGGFSVNGPTLNRFYSLHYMIPFVICGLVIGHLGILHKEGSTNKLNVDTGDNVVFISYFFIKDLLSFFLFALLFACAALFYSNFLNDSDNYIPANEMVTPAHIVPEWYFLPFYAILRSVPSKPLGVLLMGAAIVMLLLLPFIATAQHVSRNTKYRLVFPFIYWFILGDFIFLGWVGQQEVKQAYIVAGFWGTYIYFFLFLVAIPLTAMIEQQLYLRICANYKKSRR